MRKLVLPILFLLLVGLSASAADAQCANWVCERQFDDTTSCKPTVIVFRFTQYATTCDSVSSCIYAFDPNSDAWHLTCSYSCKLQSCYEV
jgi:hypothetical protein